MATLRMPEAVWQAAQTHLSDPFTEHFAFFLARWTWSEGEPVFLVRDVILVPDERVTVGRAAFELTLEALLDVVNMAVKGGDCLIEAHNHGGALPRFSLTDRAELPDFAQYVHASLPDRPYAATVWGDNTVYGEYVLADGRTGVVDSILVVGHPLRQLVSRDDDLAQPRRVFARQAPWFAQAGQQQLERLRIAVVGCGGTGSQVIQNLAYLGCRDLVLIDDDRADETNLNRLVTADFADLETAKTVLARRLVKRLAAAARVRVLDTCLQAPEALDALKGVDLIFGCVDNDGARLILNELALAYNLPYFDLATGIEAEAGMVTSAGGHLAVVLPGGPCLYCMGKIDIAEASYFLASPAERAVRVARGYVTGMDVPAPAVVSLNAMIAALAVNELAVMVSGIRPVNVLTEYDLLGDGHATKSQWLVPTQVKAVPGCPHCAEVGQGDQAGIEVRYSGG